MRRHITRATLIMAVAISGCSGPSQDQESDPARTNAGRVPASGMQQTDSTHDPDSMALHAGHQMPAAADPDPSSAGAHARHDAAAAGAGGASRGAHTGHAAAADRRAAAEHVQHAAAGGTPARAEAPHAAHAAQAAGRPDTAHAAHRDTMRAHIDSAYVAHPAPRDTSHAARADSTVAAHAGHDAAPADMGAEQQMPGMLHRMWMRQLGAGWTLMGMAQAHPIVSTSLNAGDDTSLDATELYLTQPAVMFNVESPGSRFVLRTTLNFEGLTQSDGELTFGGWGEGFLDRRHPHTLLHELMLSMNLWDLAGGALSISTGKGFASYGTDDPMSRPAVKYPTNHHLSQILERWT
ncbi:MAG: hypothetical protein ACRELT_17650, partial [Longimicrobiales bacterium]